MKQYLDQVRFVLDHGEQRGDRTGTGTLSVFGMQTRYDLRDGFPLVTTKKVNFSAVVKELLWFLRGETNIKTLGCGIWDEWADEDGELGPIYGRQWTGWECAFAGEVDNEGVPWAYPLTRFNQIQFLINQLKENPESRRHIVSAWNVGDVPDMALPPCHTMFQCYASKIPTKDRYKILESQPIKELMAVDDSDFEVGEKESFVELTTDGLCDMAKIPKYFLDLQLYQRSGDMLLGVPFNISSYSLLLMLLAREANMIPRYFIHTFGDVHIYLNHLEGAKEQLSRELRTLPRVEIANKPIPYPGCPRDGSVLEPEDFKLVGYDPWPAIKFEVAV